MIVSIGFVQRIVTNVGLKVMMETQLRKFQTVPEEEGYEWEVKEYSAVAHREMIS